jgi:hypothetical protein
MQVRLTIDIEYDDKMTLDNAIRLLKAGANRLVSESAVGAVKSWSADVEFKKPAHKKITEAMGKRDV